LISFFRKREADLRFRSRRNRIELKERGGVVKTRGKHSLSFFRGEVATVPCGKKEGERDAGGYEKKGKRKETLSRPLKKRTAVRAHIKKGNGERGVYTR